MAEKGDAGGVWFGKVDSQGLHEASFLFPNAYLAQIQKAECLKVSKNAPFYVDKKS
jgi:hypothetical protein